MLRNIRMIGEYNENGRYIGYDYNSNRYVVVVNNKVVDDFDCLYDAIEYYDETRKY